MQCYICIINTHTYVFILQQAITSNGSTTNKSKINNEPTKLCKYNLRPRTISYELKCGKWQKSILKCIIAKGRSFCYIRCIRFFWYKIYSVIFKYSGDPNLLINRKLTIISIRPDVNGSCSKFCVIVLSTVKCLLKWRDLCCNQI